MSDPMTAQSFEVPASVDRVRNRAAVLGVAGLAAMGAGAALDPPQFFQSYLVALIFWSGIALGCLALLMVHHLSGGAWGLVIRRILEAATGATERAMRTKLSWVAVATLLAGACGCDFEPPAASQPDGLALVTVRPTQAASLSQASVAGCAWCTTAFGAELAVTSSQTLTGVNLWLDGWSGNRRCLYAQHDTPTDGFTLPAGEPVVVSFRQATVECAAPFTIDRVDARARSGESLVYQGSWKVQLEFRE